MAQYIDKDALVAEIERRVADNKKDIERASHKNLEDYFEGYEDALVLLKEQFLDTLEVKEISDEYNGFLGKELKIVDNEIARLEKLKVKEVDLDLEITLWANAIPEIRLDDVERLAKYFFELGLKAKDWEKERMEECPYRRVGCTMYEGHILECKGACSWVVDYPKLKEFKAQKGEK